MSQAGAIERDWRLTSPKGSEGNEAANRSSYLPILLVTVIPDQDGREIKKLHQLFPASIEYEAPGVYSGRILCLPGCVTQGAGRKEVKELLRDALREVLDAHRRRGTHPIFEDPAEIVDPGSLVNVALDVEAS